MLVKPDSRNARFVLSSRYSRLAHSLQQIVWPVLISCNPSVCFPRQTKCEQYWPEQGQEEYGPYQVTLRSSRNLAYYTLRTFIVRDTANKVGLAHAPN